MEGTRLAHAGACDIAPVGVPSAYVVPTPMEEGPGRLTGALSTVRVDVFVVVSAVLGVPMAAVNVVDVIVVVDGAVPTTVAVHMVMVSPWARCSIGWVIVVPSPRGSGPSKPWACVGAKAVAN